MKGAFITNKYYSDAGMDYVYSSLSKAFDKIPLVKVSPDLIYCNTLIKPKIDADFVIFWDKLTVLARMLENQGLKVFNCADAIEACDDKQKTYSYLKGVKIPKTISAPLMYDVNNITDTEFLNTVEKEIKYPLIVKENTGSQGRQVYKADNRSELNALYEKLKHKSHHYQELIGEYGSDLRIYTIGGKAAGAYIRKGLGFKSNLYCGGTAKLTEPKKEYIDNAEYIAQQLKLDFGAVDFLLSDEPIFLEANSNAYFKGIEELGVNIAEKIAAHIKKKVYNI